MIRLKFLRKKAKLTQKELAAMLGISQPTICSYENGNSVPSINMLQPIANALFCNIQDLFPEPNKFTR